VKGRKGVPPEDAKDVAQSAATALDPVPAFAFTREFRKNRKTGQIWAIELVNGVLAAALECTKPEEMTDGALPVLPLESSTASLDVYRAAQGQCDAWEPERTPDGLRRNLVAAGHRLDDVETKIGKKKAELKRLNEQRDEVVAQIRRFVRELETGQTNLLDKVAPETAPAAPAAPEAAEEAPPVTGTAEAPSEDAAATAPSTPDPGPPSPDDNAGSSGDKVH